MHESFLKDIAVVLGVAALTSTLSHRFRLPSVLGYLIAGLMIGPYLPFPLFADLNRVESLSEFGVILVMFSIGLEFSLAKFFRVIPTSGVTAALEIGAMFLVGMSIGYLFNWTTEQSIFMGGALAISSTMIVSKIFEERHPTQATREHVLGILVVQDVVAIILLTVLGAFAASNHLSLESIVPTVVKLIFILLLLTGTGLFIVPKFIRYISKQNNSETLIIVSVGLCFVLASVVETLGYSVALGAFLAGILVAESGKGHRIERLSKPTKDIFVAIFFVSIGMTVDPFLAVKVLPQSLIVSALVILAQFFVVFAGSILSGAGMNRALFSSLALGQIGEFSFIIAAIGASAGMVSKEFQAIIVSVAVLTSLSTPLLWKNSKQIILFISRITPEKMRITIGLYEAWFNRIRESSSEEGILGIPKKVIVGLILDSLLLIALPPLFLTFLPGVLEKVGVDESTLFGKLLILSFLAIILIPILFGFVKMSSSLIIRLSHSVFPVNLTSTKEQNPAEKLFKLTLWSLLSLVVSFPLLASLRPFVDNFLFNIITLLIFFTIIYRLWRSAGKVTLEYEAAGSEKLVAVIKSQTFSAIPELKSPPRIPGLEDLESILIEGEDIPGKTVSDLDIRNRTGATIVSISRGTNQIMFPSNSIIIRKGDIIHIWGTPQSKQLCKEILK